MVLAQRFEICITLVALVVKRVVNMIAVSLRYNLRWCTKTSRFFWNLRLVRLGEDGQNIFLEKTKEKRMTRKRETSRDKSRRQRKITFQDSSSVLRGQHEGKDVSHLKRTQLACVRL